MDSENYQLDLPYTSSSVSIYWKKITIPKGLPALLETFVRETIRENPDDIYKFLADLTQSMLGKQNLKKITVIKNITSSLLFLLRTHHHLYTR